MLDMSGSKAWARNGGCGIRHFAWNPEPETTANYRGNLAISAISAGNLHESHGPAAVRAAALAMRLLVSRFRDHGLDPTATQVRSDRA